MLKLVSLKKITRLCTQLNIILLFKTAENRRNTQKLVCRSKMLYTAAGEMLSILLCPVIVPKFLKKKPRTTLVERKENCIKTHTIFIRVLRNYLQGNPFGWKICFEIVSKFRNQYVFPRWKTVVILIKVGTIDCHLRHLAFVYSGFIIQLLHFSSFKFLAVD